MNTSPAPIVSTTSTAGAAQATCPAGPDASAPCRPRLMTASASARRSRARSTVAGAARSVSAAASASLTSRQSARRAQSRASARAGPSSALRRPAGVESHAHPSLPGVGEQRLILVRERRRQKGPAEQQPAARQSLPVEPVPTCAQVSAAEMALVVKKVRSPSGWVIPGDTVEAPGLTGQSAEYGAS